MTRLAALLLACVLPVAAAAERLRVDLIVFGNPPTANQPGTAPRHPVNEAALAMDDARGLAQVGITLLPESASTLATEWAALKASRRYSPLLRMSWVQESSSADGGPALRVYLPGGDGVSALEGWLRLNAGVVPVLTADLELAQSPGQSHRLQARRNLPIGSLHYLDSAGLGVLARVTPAR